MALILDAAQLPHAKEFKYTPKLMELLEDTTSSLQQTYAAFERARSGNDQERQAKHLGTLLEKVQTAAERVAGQFFRDNLPETDYKKFLKGKFEGLKITLNLETIAAQLNILKEVSRGDTSAAKAKARAFILRSVLHVGEAAQLHPLTVKLADALAEIHLRTVQHVLFPIMEKKILEFSQRGALKSFGLRAKQTGSLFADWVRTPFHKKSRDRMARSLTPALSLSITGGYDQLLPIVRDLAQTAYHVSLSHGQLLELLDTIAGAVAFDALTIAVTLGAGAAVKGGHITGTAAKGLAALTLVSGTARKVMNPARGIHYTTNLLTVEDLKQRAMDLVGKAYEQKDVMSERVQGFAESVSAKGVGAITEIADNYHIPLRGLRQVDQEE